jgi:hypothetical protein
MYTTRNYRTKSALKLAVANAQRVELFNPAAEITGVQTVRVAPQTLSA